MKCAFPPDICQLTAGRDYANYQCPETQALEEILADPRDLIPQIQPTGSHFLEKDGKVDLRLEESVIALKISVEGLELTTSFDDNDVTVITGSPTGCFDCTDGALLPLSCQTDHGMAIVQVICTSGIGFSVLCHAHTTNHTVRIFSHVASLNENCTATNVGTGRTKLISIIGTLTEEAPAESRPIGYSDSGGPFRGGSSDINLIQYWQFLTGHYEEILVFLGAVLGGILLLVVVIKIVIACF